MLVFDTSAFINGWRYHYPPQTFPTVWDIIGAGIDDGRIIAPREVYVELEAKDDEVLAWAKPRRARFVDPDDDVQRELGAIAQLFPRYGLRDQADPFVVAEAKVRGFAVVTYEGTNTMTGQRTKNADQRMPGVCSQVGVDCCIVPEGLRRLGATI